MVLWWNRTRRAVGRERRVWCSSLPEGCSSRPVSMLSGQSPDGKHKELRGARSNPTVEVAICGKLYF